MSAAWLIPVLGVKRHGGRPVTVTPSDVIRWREMAKSGCTHSVIARATGYDRSTIARYIGNRDA